MEIRFTLALPRDALSVPVVRRILNRSLGTLGVEDSCIGDIEIALTEACTNVLDHAHEGDEYHVSAGVDDATCVIEVIDAGRGFDAERLGHADADHSAEEGRGIQLIRALVDHVHFSNRPERGSIVRFEKQLEFESGAPLKELIRRRREAAYPADEPAAEEAAAEEREQVDALVEAIAPGPEPAGA